ncbi:hypothetical protein KP509_36G042600 [Ceratopteris richardii]|uniref:BSD2 cysteine rich domain-containing protein n=1 Tax=Ceratopteris richardii TaxID=49495 RepID=A0A8T2QCK6_CERRI|nr:hypothetical protein KP509_36G042600 [Ceratopteris richardii]
MAMTSVSRTLPPAPPLVPGNARFSCRKIFVVEEKAACRSPRGITCSCSNLDQSFFWKSSELEKHRSVKARSTEPETVEEPAKPPETKTLFCKECDGNGAILCSQCKGDGINKQDFFGGHFKAGGLCWLCRGKRETICGNCNGAGFMGGYLNALED